VFDAYKNNCEFIEIFRTIARNTTQNVHHDVVLALEDIGSDAVIPTLIELTHMKPEILIKTDVPYDLARRAIWAIAKVRTDRSLVVLRALANDPDEEIAGLAQHVLKKAETFETRRLD
jgi:HEAT repeat protein